MTLRSRAIDAIASTVAPGGTLIVVSGIWDGDGPRDGPPWPLTRSELDRFERDAAAGVGRRGADRATRRAGGASTPASRGRCPGGRQRLWVGRWVERERRFRGMRTAPRVDRRCTDAYAPNVDPHGGAVPPIDAVHARPASPPPYPAAVDVRSNHATRLGGATAAPGSRRARARAARGVGRVVEHAPHRRGDLLRRRGQRDRARPRRRARRPAPRCAAGRPRSAAAPTAARAPARPARSPSRPARRPRGTTAAAPPAGSSAARGRAAAAARARPGRSGGPWSRRPARRARARRRARAGAGRRTRR